MLRCACGTGLADGARACPSCGADVRPAATQWLVRLVARAVAWSLAALAMRALFAGGWLARGGGEAFLFVFGRSLRSVAESLVAVIVTVGFFALLAEMTVGDRVPVFKPYVRAVGKVLALIPRAALWSFRAAYLAVEGKPLPNAAPKPGKRKAGKEEKPDG